MTATHDASVVVPWREAVLLTMALWLFVLLIYMPMLLDRHAGGSLSSVALDGSTVFVSMLFGVGLFAVFRATLRWPETSRVIALGATVVVIAVFQSMFDLLFTAWIADNLDSSWAVLPRNMTRAYAAAFNYVCAFGVNLALFQMAFARRCDVAHERQLAEAHSAAQQAQLMALRFQLNPHFLFNTLNAISAMIVTGRNAEAEQMTSKLSTFLRTTLASDPAELVPVEEELALIEEYLEIESVRFGERLSVAIHCTPEAGAAPVPSLLLQPIVENAIKYGVGRSQKPVRVVLSGAVDGDTLLLSVEDDATALDDTACTHGTGVGLTNVRRRLAAHYGGAASLEAGPGKSGFRVAIRIPVTAPSHGKQEA